MGQIGLGSPTHQPSLGNILSPGCFSHLPSMSPNGGYGGSPAPERSADASLGKKFSEAIAAHSRDTQTLPSLELSEVGKGGRFDGDSM